MAKIIQNLALVFYRRKAEEGGYLRDFRMTRTHFLDGVTLVGVSGTVAATGRGLLREIQVTGIEAAIDQDIITEINLMVSEAKSLSAGIVATLSCCAAHAQGAAAVDGCSNASDAIKFCVVCEVGGHVISECPRTYIPRRDKCGRGKHEADGDMKIVAHPIGSYIFAEDRRTRTETGLKMCSHCRSLFVPR